MSEPAAVELFQKVKSLFTDTTLNRQNIFKFLEMAMELVELTELSGAQKKALVIESIKLAANEMIPDEEEYKIVEHYVAFFIDQTIDEIIEINDGKLKINPKRSKFYTCFTGCGKFFGKCKCPFRNCFKPKVEAPAPVAEDPAPVAEDPAPVAEDPAPVAEDPTPAPVEVEEKA